MRHYPSFIARERHGTANVDRDREKERKRKRGDVSLRDEDKK